MRARMLDDRFAVRRSGLIPLVLAVTLLAASSISGCATDDAIATTPKPQPPATTEAKSQTPDPDPRSATTPDGGVDAEALSALAARDMADLRALRQAADTAPPTAPATSDGVADTGRVRWNSPQRGHRTDEPPASVAPKPVAAKSTAVARTDPAAAEAAEIVSAPTPAETGAGGDPLSLDEMSMLLVRLRQQLYRASIDSDQPLRELLAIAAMSIVDPDLSLPDSASRELTGDELEVLASFHTFFQTLGQRLDASNEADDTILTAIDDLRDAIDRGPQLELPASALCWRIGGFGDYDAFSRNAFLAHSQRQVILYLEIEGFVSEQNSKGQWVTETAQQLEIYSESDGIPVWSEPWQKAVDVAAKKRRDFFTSQLITLPAALSVGAYRLKIRVRDERSGAETEQSIPFEMVADEKLAAQVGGS